MSNGSPTSQTIDGVTIDLNRISVRQFANLTAEMEAAAENVNKRIELSGKLVAMIVTAWPFEQPITPDGYQDLGLLDSALVDGVIQQIGEILRQKKLERLSTYLPNTASPLMTLSPDGSIQE